MSGFGLALKLKVENWFESINQPHSPTGDVFEFMNHSEQELSLLKIKKKTIYFCVF